MSMKTKTRIGCQHGATLVELALLLPVFTLLFLGVFDVGRGYYFAMEVANAARAGAQYGYQSSGTMIDSTGIQNAAIDDAVDVGASGSCSKSACWSSGYPKSSWGCMCSDGTSKSTSCAAGTLTCSTNSRQVNYVDVQTKAIYQPMIAWPGIPSSGVTLSGETLLWAGE